jgi:hypothetical protein
MVEHKCFIKAINPPRFFKFIRKDMRHHDYIYKVGLNELPANEEFNPYGS